MGAIERRKSHGSVENRERVAKVFQWRTQSGVTVKIRKDRTRLGPHSRAGVKWHKRFKRSGIQSE